MPVMILALVLLGAAGCGPSDADFSEFASFNSPDMKYRVTVETAPKNGFAYSPEAVRVYLGERGVSDRKLVATASLANDGGAITDENIQTKWLDSQTVRLCLSGAEQDDEVLVINVRTASFTAESTECGDRDS